jgi:hypothetical protein
MATDITAWDRAYRAIRYRVEINTTPQPYGLDYTTGTQTKLGTWVDYTDYIDNITLFSYIEDNKRAGIVQTESEIILNQEAFSYDLQKTGIRVKIYIETSTDNWATSNSWCVYRGATTEKSTVTPSKIILKLVDIMGRVKNMILPGNVSGQSISASDLIRILFGLSSGKVYGINTNWQTSPITITKYNFNDKNKTEKNLKEICENSNYLIRVKEYEEAGVGDTIVVDSCDFYDVNLNDSTVMPVDARLPEGINVFGSSTPLDIHYSLDSIIEYIDLGSNGNYNTVISNKNTKKYVDGGVLYKNLNLTNYVCKSGETTTFLLPIPQDIVELISFESFIFYGGNESVSYYQFLDADVDTGGLVFVGYTWGASLVRDDQNNRAILVTVNNPLGFDIYLKKINVVGVGYITTQKERLTTQDSNLIAADGKESILELPETKVQIDSIQTVHDLILDKEISTKRSYRFIAKGKPQIRVGDVITIETIDQITRTVQILEIDSEISRDRGFEQTILAKEI